MIDLYTVTLERQLNITVYEGKTARTESKRIREVYKDLPLATAQMYRTKVPDAFVAIERQAPEPTRGQDPYRKPKARVYAADEEKVVVKKVEREPAIGGGDYADVINKMSRRA